MRTFKLLLLYAGLLMGVQCVQAQSAEVPAAVLAAFASGNATEISEYLGPNVELVIENSNDVFSREQASVIINDFFRKHKVSNFQLLHKGNKDATSFAIANMKTSNGVYRVYILTRKGQIQQLRIEPSND